MAGSGLKEGARGASASKSQQRLRNAFVVGELAVALVLLVGAGLLVKTFWKLRNVDPGFSPDHLLTMRVELPETRYKEIEPQTRFRTQALANINSLPGAQSAMISELPLSGDSLNHDFLIEGRPPIAAGDEPSLETRPGLSATGFRSQRAFGRNRQRRDGQAVFSQREPSGQARSLGA